MSVLTMEREDKHMPPQALVDAWVEDGDWRRVAPWEDQTGHEARRALADLYLYPSESLEDDTHALQAERYRAALHTIVDQLDRTDVAGLFKLARLLALDPRSDEDVFGYIDSLTRRAELYAAHHYEE